MHAGAVIVPAVLAACERHRPDGAAALLGIAVGIETMCRLVHRGAEGRAQGRLPSDRDVRRDGRGRRRRRGARARTPSRSSMRSASPAAWPPASSNISPRAPGPSACIPAGRRNRACARRCWRAPASSGRARCSRACTGCFTASRTPRKGDYDALLGDFGTRWVTETLAFKPYPCGTMTHPYIDCARRLAARGIKAGDVKEMICEVARAPCTGCGSRSPPSSARPTAMPPNSPRPIMHRHRLRARQRRARAISPTRRCAIRPCSRSPPRCATSSIPNNPYPNNFTGHIRAVLNDGSVVEERQPHFRGGATSR